MGQALLGIEIGNSNIKVVQGIRKRKELVLTHYGIEHTPKGAVRDGYIMDMDAVFNSLQSLIKRKGFTAKNTAIIVQGTSIITRDVLMPPMSEKELRTILDYQKDEYFPIDVSDYQTDFKVLNEVETEEGKKLNVLLVAAPNNIIESSMELIKRLNLKPKIIDIASNAISKIFASRSFGFHDENSSIMVLDIGGQTTTVTILSEGNILFSRSILYGFEHLNELIRDEFGEKDIYQVEMFKRKYAALYYQDKSLDEDLYGGYISYLVKPAVENNIMQEINRFLEFYYSRSHAKKIRTIYLVGGGAYLKNITHYIEKMLNIPTMQADVFEDIKVKSISEFDNDFLYLVNALGLISRI